MFTSKWWAARVLGLLGHLDTGLAQLFPAHCQEMNRARGVCVKPEGLQPPDRVLR